MYVSREAIDLLTQYQKLVLKWNKTINLVAQSTIDDFWNRHIMDCIQLLKFIKNKNIHIVDIGSGAGLPGIVLSIMGIKKVTLIESNSKKGVFLYQAAQISPNNIQILNKRIETVNIKCDIVVARAFADCKRIFEYTKNIIVSDKYLLLKGKNYKQELEKYHYITYNSITDRYGKIVEIYENHFNS